MKNDWKTRDPGRSRARSDGREKLATWPASQAFELAANRRVRLQTKRQKKRIYAIGLY